MKEYGWNKMTQQKANKRIAELELEIMSLIRLWDSYYNLIESVKSKIKDFQQEIVLLNSKGNLFKELDKHLRKEKK
jgi:hypothetical protein